MSIEIECYWYMGRMRWRGVTNESDEEGRTDLAAAVPGLCFLGKWFSQIATRATIRENILPYLYWPVNRITLKEKSTYHSKPFLSRRARHF